MQKDDAGSALALESSHQEARAPASGSQNPNKISEKLNSDVQGGRFRKNHITVLYRLGYQERISQERCEATARELGGFKGHSKVSVEHSSPRHP